MADVILSAELQARVDSFVANLLAAANSATNTATATTQMSTTISRNIANVNRTNLTQFTAALNAGTLSIQRLGIQAAAIPNIVRPLNTGVRQAGQSMTDFSRILQDLPYGINGIANNINPAIESFGRLKAETGSTGAALRALVGSLTGAGGFGLAVSAITTALTFASIGFGAWTRGFGGGKKEVDSATKANEEYKKSVDSIATATGQQLANLEILYRATQDVNRPLAERKKIVDELQAQYPNYFGNLKDEAILAGKAALAYKSLQQQLINTAIVKASEGLLANKFKELADLSLSLAESERKLRGAGLNEAQVKSLQTVVIDKTLNATEIKQAGNNDTFALADYKKRVTDAIKNTQEAISGLFSGFSSDSLLGDFGEKVKDKKIKLKLDKLELQLPDNPQDLLRKFFNEISGINAPGTLTVKAPEKLKIDGVKAKIDLGQLFQFDSADLDKAIENLKLQQKLNDIVIGAEQEIIKLTSLPGLIDATAGALSQSFSAIGEAIASGGDVLAAAGGVIQQTFADLLAALGKQFITMGAAKIAAGILASPFGGKLIADGAGLIALGAGLSLGGGIVGGAGKGKTSGGVTAFANGGIISGPTLGLMGEYAGAKSDPEVVAPLSKLKNLLGETDDAGNVIAKNRNEPIVLVADTVIRGQDIVTSYRKASGTRNRQG